MEGFTEEIRIDYTRMNGSRYEMVIEDVDNPNTKLVLYWDNVELKFYIENLEAK